MHNVALSYIFAVSCGKEHGCPSENNVFGVVLIVILTGGVLAGIAGWAWFRWERGPFPLLMRVFGIRTGKDR
jgi:hypothetical protein